MSLERIKTNGVVLVDFCELVTVVVVDAEQRHVERAEMVSVRTVVAVDERNDVDDEAAAAAAAPPAVDDDADEFFVNDLLLIDFLLL